MTESAIAVFDGHQPSTAIVVGEHLAQLWDLETGRVRALHSHHVAPPIIDAAKSAQHQLLAVGGQNGVRLIALTLDSPPSLLLRLPGHQNVRVYRLAFHPTEKRLYAGTGDRQIYYWSFADSADAKTLCMLPRSINDIAIGRTGKVLAAATDDGLVFLIDVRTGHIIAKLAGHSGPALAVSFLPDRDQLVSTGSDGTIRLWDTDAGRELSRKEITDKGQHHRLRASTDSIAFLDNAGNGNISVWKSDLSGKRCGLPGTHAAFTLLPDSSGIVTAGRILQRWTMAGKAMTHVDGPTGPLDALYLSSDDQFVAGVTVGGEVSVWMAATGRRAAGIDKDTSRQDRSIVLGTSRLTVPASPSIRSNEDRLVLLLAGAKPQLVELPHHGRRHRHLHVFLSRSRAFAMAYDDRNCYLWSLPHRRRIGAVELIGAQQEGLIELARFSEDESTVVLIVSTGGARRLVLLDVLLMVQYSIIDLPAGSFATACAMSPDGSLLAVGNDLGQVDTYRTDTKVRAHRISTDGGSIHALQFLGNSQQLLTGHFNSTAALWSVSQAAQGGQVRECTLKEIESNWGKLGSADIITADRAMKGLSLCRQFPEYTLAKYSEHRDAPKAIEGLVSKLGDSDFRRREDAQRALEQLGLEALPIVQNAEQHAASGEALRRMRALSSPSRLIGFSEAQRTTLRAIKALEQHSDTERSLTVLKRIKEYSHGETVALWAGAAIERIERRLQHKETSAGKGR